MENISTIRDLVGLWPSRQDFAQDLPVPVSRVHKWIAANAIPAKHHLSVVESGRRRGLPVTAELLVRLHGALANDETKKGAA